MNRRKFLQLLIGLPFVGRFARKTVGGLKFEDLKCVNDQMRRDLRPTIWTKHIAYSGSEYNTIDMTYMPENICVMSDEEFALYVQKLIKEYFT